MIFDSFDISILNSGDFSEQAGDLSFVFYVLYSDFLQFFFGNGVGMSSDVIAEFTRQYMSLKGSFILINSRWVFYTILIDFGFIGLSYFIYLISKFLPRDQNYKTISLLSVIASVFTASYLFVFIIIVFRFLESKTTKA
jgi:hypothetical protein